MKRRADGRWQKVKTINGKKVFFYSSADTERKAVKDIEAQMLQYTEKQEAGKLFSEVADEWESVHYVGLEHQTVYRYKSLVARLVSHFGEELMKQIKSTDVELFFETMVLQGFSTKTIKDEMSVLKMIFKHAMIKEYIDNNVVFYLSPPKGKPKRERQSLTDAEISAVTNNLHIDFGFLAFFLLYTGLRKGEALALRKSDIDFEACVINVNKSVEYVDHKPRIKSPKTEAGHRQVPLLDIVKDNFPKYKNNDILFSQNREYMTDSYFFKHWKKYQNATGLNITPHQLRHTFTTLLFEWGIDEKDSQEMLGHADISTTRNIYTHIRKGRLENTLERMNAALISSVAEEETQR